MISRVLRRNPEVLSSEMEDETILMAPQSGAYCTLNKTGAAIWRLLETPCAVDEIIDHLSEKYSQKRDKIEHPVLGFVTRMEEQELLVTDTQNRSVG